MSNPVVGNRADEEANLRRALSTTYEVEVQGSSQENGDLWDIGLDVKIDDKFAGMVGIFLIKQVEYSITASKSGGTITRLTCVPRDAYTVRGQVTARDKRKTSIGGEFQKTDGEVKKKFTR